MAARLIDDPATLERLLATLGEARWLGLATESNTMSAYRPAVCLVQLAVGRADEVEIVAIDPLAFGSRPHPLAALPERLAPDALVLVHGGEYTLAGLRRDHIMDLQHTSGLRDLQQAAVLLGLPETGYRSLCRGLLGEVVPAPISVDWRQRPLAAASVEHALEDVRHLGRLWATLTPAIARADLADELALASALVAQTTARANLPDPARFKHLDGAAALGAAGLWLLQALVGWRDQKARELDLPPGKLFPNLQLVALARRPDRAADELARMRFHSRLVFQDREALRRLVVLTIAEPPPRAPPSQAPRPPRALGPAGPVVKARLERLKRWRREEAERRGVGLAAILPGVALEHIAFQQALTVAALQSVPHLGARRIERYAAVLIALFEGTG